MESPPISVTLADTKGHYGTPFKKKRNNNSGPLHRWKEGQRKNTNEDHNHFLWETTTNRTFTEYTTKNRSDRQYIELKTYGTGVENLTNKKGTSYIKFYRIVSSGACSESDQAHHHTNAEWGVRIWRTEGGHPHQLTGTIYPDHFQLTSNHHWSNPWGGDTRSRFDTDKE